MSREARLIVDQLLHDLENRPDDFVCDRHCLEDGKTGFRYWVANGVMAYGVHEPWRLGFGLWQSMRFSQGLSKWKAYEIINKSQETINAQ